MLDDNCIFCKIAAGEIPSETVYEDEQFRAILDLGPASAGHTLILPKAHFKDVTEISDEYAANVLKVAAKLGKAMKKGLGCEGFNLVQNNGEAAGQTVMHFHMHVIPRYEGGPANIANSVPGTASAEELTEAAGGCVKTQPPQGVSSETIIGACHPDVFTHVPIKQVNSVSRLPNQQTRNAH